jgi:DNA-binding LacI/PurR family transcriptional regulator
MESGRSLADWYFENPAPKPSAMIISNDNTAIGFMDGVKRRGVRIPEDLSVISFDNIMYSVINGIDLTTVDPHISEICSESVRLMLKQLQSPEAKKEKVIIAPTLYVRKTTMVKDAYY